MDYLVLRLIQLLERYHSLPVFTKQLDSLSIVNGLKLKGEQISLLGYCNSNRLQMSTLTVDNLASFTEKRNADVPTSGLSINTDQAVSDQLVQFIRDMIRLIEQFKQVFQTNESCTEIVDLLKIGQDELIRVYDAPYSVTIEIKKVASFTSTSADHNQCKENAAEQVVRFLKQLAEKI